MGRSRPPLAPWSALPWPWGSILFFSEPDRQAVRVVRTAARQQLTSTWSPLSSEALSPTNGAGRLESVLMTMAPVGRSGTYPAADAREAFAFIVEGDVTLTLEDEVYRLGTGDAMTFASAHPHQWENPGAGVARVLLVVGRVSREGQHQASDEARPDSPGGGQP